MLRRFPKKQFILLGGDIVLIIASFYLAPALRFGLWLDPSTVFSSLEIGIIFIYVVLFYIFDFYNLDDRFSSITYILRVGFAITIVNVFLASLFYFINVTPYGRGLIFYNAFLVFIFIYGWRIIFGTLGKQIRRPVQVIILGCGLAGRFVYELIKDNKEFEVIGFLDDDAKKQGMNIGVTSVLGGSEHLLSSKDNWTVDMILVAITHAIQQEVYKRLVEAKMNGIEVYNVPTFCEKIMGKVPANHVSDLWFASVPISGVQRNVYNQKIKKICDKFLSLVGLIVSSPISLITALAIKIESKGPIFYRQTRTGQNGHPFEVVKFRSMKVDAEANGAVWAVKKDPRVTRVGKIIRLLRIDETPQLWNVLRGDMSLIGPRPERPEFVKELIEDIPYYSLRHAVAPGITGWAQVNYPYGASKEDALAKLEYDLYYIKNLSPLLDLIILARTVRTVLFGKGAR